MIPSPSNIGLIVGLSSKHVRGMIRGISRYSQSYGPWQLRLVERLTPTAVRGALAAIPYDGLIVRAESSALIVALADCQLPIVNAGSFLTKELWHHVDTDNAAVSELAARHLLERGYKHFGFCGMRNWDWARWRLEHFQAELSRHDLTCELLEISFRGPEQHLLAKDRRALCQWIASLPKPSGIMACNDHCGRAVLEACHDIGVSVPDEIGVIGVDNDELICELCSPPLSSIQANCEMIGYVAAKILDGLLHGEQLATCETLIKPTTVVSRCSTDETAVNDPIVAEAIRYIRTYGNTKIGALEIARHVHVSRRYLEQQFRTTTGSTLHAEIQRVRLETAQRLLGETDWSLQIIAERSGFKHASHMSYLFQQQLNIRPGEYRRRIQNPGEAE